MHSAQHDFKGINLPPMRVLPGTPMLQVVDAILCHVDNAAGVIASMTESARGNRQRLLNAVQTSLEIARALAYAAEEGARKHVHEMPAAELVERIAEAFENPSSEGAIGEGLSVADAVRAKALTLLSQHSRAQGGSHV